MSTTYEIEGHRYQAETPDQAYAMHDAAMAKQADRAEMEARPWYQKLASGAVDPMVEAYMGGKQLLGGDLSDEDKITLEGIQERRATNGGWGLAGEVGSMLLPMGAAAKVGGKVLTKALPQSKYIPKITAPVVGENVGASAVEGTLQGLKPVEEGESRLENAGDAFAQSLMFGGLADVGGRALTKTLGAVARPVMPSREALRLERQAADKGVNIDFTPGQYAGPGKFGGMVRGVEETLSRVPGGAGLREARENAMANWNLSEIRQALPDDMAKMVNTSGPRGMEQLQRAFNRKYNEAFKDVAGMKIQPSMQTIDNLIQAQRQAERLAESGNSGLSRSGAMQDINNLFTDLVDGRIGPENYKEWVSSFTTKASQAANRGDKVEAEFYRQMHHAINQEMKDMIGPQAAKILDEADQAYARVMPLVNASGMQGAVRAGNFTPTQMLHGAQAGQSNWGKAQARDPAAKRALTAEHVFGTTLPNVGPGTAEKLAGQAMIGSMTGLGGTLLAGGDMNDAMMNALYGGLAVPAVAGAYGSNAARNALVGRTRLQRAMSRLNQKAVAPAVAKTRPLARTMGIVGTREEEQ